MIETEIDQFPNPPSTDDKANFDDRADEFVGHFQPFVTQVNNWAIEVNGLTVTLTGLEQDAFNSRQAAQISENNASDSADAAAASAASITGSVEDAQAAATSAGNNATIAQNAANAAEAAQTAAEAAEDGVAADAAAAEQAKDDAEAAATAAGLSETNSATNATNAGLSADEAQESANDADGSATSASGSASTATTQAGIATTQAGIATTQAGIATDKAGEASGSADAAEQFAIDAENSAQSVNAANLLKVNQNLADLGNVETAKTNLGLAAVASSGSYSDLVDVPTFGSAAFANTGDFATAAQGSLAASALQPGDNISVLTNDAGYITSAPVASVNGETGAVSLDTDNIGEGASNLYYTAARANAAIDARVTKTFVDALNINASTLNGNSSSAFATSAQGALADSAVQPGSLAAVATSGQYSDLSGTPTLGTAAAESDTKYNHRNNNLSDVVNVTTARTNLGLGSLATLSTINNANWSGTELSISNGGTGSPSAAGAFNSLKQAATTTSTGVVEIATEAEAIAGTAGKVPDAAGVLASIQENASGGGGGAAFAHEMSVKTDTATNTGGAGYVDTGLDVTITLNSATSKLLLVADMSVGDTTNNNGNVRFIFTDSSNTALEIADTSGSAPLCHFISAVPNNFAISAASGSIVITPGSVGPHTYKVRWANLAFGSSSHLNRASVDSVRAVSTLFAMELPE